MLTPAATSALHHGSAQPRVQPLCWVCGSASSAPNLHSCGKAKPAGRGWVPHCSDRIPTWLQLLSLDNESTQDKRQQRAAEVGTGEHPLHWEGRGGEERERAKGRRNKRMKPRPKQHQKSLLRGFSAGCSPFLCVSREEPQLLKADIGFPSPACLCRVLCTHKVPNWCGNVP